MIYDIRHVGFRHDQVDGRVHSLQGLLDGVSVDSEEDDGNAGRYPLNLPSGFQSVQYRHG